VSTLRLVLLSDDSELELTRWSVPDDHRVTACGLAAQLRAFADRLETWRAFRDLVDPVEDEGDAA